jgi:predicted nucleic acid-binding protein
MYLDTSVAVKLFLPEPDSDECELIVGGLGFFSSELLMGELRSAILRKERSGHISAAMRGQIWERFEGVLDAGVVELIPLNGTIVREASELMAQLHPTVPLRTLDAIHLATFLSVDAGPLFTRDRRMLDAAKQLGIPLAAG